MITTERAKELREKERQQTIETLERINKKMKINEELIEKIDKEYEAYKEGFCMGKLLTEQGEFIGDYDLEEYVEDSWSQFFFEKEQEENNE